ncbi:ATP-binding cassette domain-containing protein [Niallia oryzisoli]|uniref:ATP-binding cassette domain-containing protein n=1 Tax=Niallia oryzisoli TaxID=1737571 RepID=A0ABZ2C9N2_9BACI
MHQKMGVELNIHQLRKSYNHLEVLHDVNLSIASGEFVAIVGKSGCGKSTLLRHIAGLEHATAGEIKQNHKVINGLNQSARIMFQEARLLPWQSVLENVGVGLSLKKGWEHRAEWALEQVGLAERANDWPSVLSGGQKQRVALARALAGDPSLLLLDEPLGALDALTRLEMQALIEELWQQQKFTAILVTHDVNEAISLADRVILIEKGSVKMDLRIPLPRPRNRANPDFAELEEMVLSKVLGKKEPLKKVVNQSSLYIENNILGGI